jgi:TonB family protein
MTARSPVAGAGSWLTLILSAGCAAPRAGTVAAVGTPPPGDLPVYEVRAVERWADPVHQPGPNYPPELRRKEKCGHVNLRFIVDPKGRVEPWSIVVVSASDTGFATAAIRAIEQSRYRPALREGKPVRQWSTRRVLFAIRGAPDQPDCPSARPKVVPPGRRRPDPPA